VHAEQANLAKLPRKLPRRQLPGVVPVSDVRLHLLVYELAHRAANGFLLVV